MHDLARHCTSLKLLQCLTHTRDQTTQKSRPAQDNRRSDHQGNRRTSRQTTYVGIMSSTEESNIPQNNRRTCPSCRRPQVCPVKTTPAQLPQETVTSSWCHRIHLITTQRAYHQHSSQRRKCKRRPILPHLPRFQTVYLGLSHNRARPS